MLTPFNKTQGDAGPGDISDTEYQAIGLFLSRNCGIVIGEGKHYLVRNRLLPVLRKHQMVSYAELVSALQSNSLAVQCLQAEVVDAMTTNETFWFRDEKQFIELREKVLPHLFLQKNTQIKIWSAACSSGQEPYSISMAALEAQKTANPLKPVQIIATDISQSVLGEAKSAIYSELALTRGMDPANRARYFQRHHDGYSLIPEVTRQVRFQQFNLLKSFQALGRFDIIFCRNVLIYFSDQVKRDILMRMADSLEAGGYLFLSSTEAVSSDLKAFEPVRGGLTNYFRKVG